MPNPMRHENEGKYRAGRGEDICDHALSRRPPRASCQVRVMLEKKLMIKKPRYARCGGTVTVLPAAGGFLLAFSRGTIWEKLPVCLSRDKNGTGSWEATWLTGRDGSARFLGGTERGRGMGRKQVGKSVGNIYGKTVRNSRENGREHGREHSREIDRQRSRDMAGRRSPEWLGTRSGTRAGDNGRKEES